MSEKSKPPESKPPTPPDDDWGTEGEHPNRPTHIHKIIGTIVNCVFSVGVVYKHTGLSIESACIDRLEQLMNGVFYKWWELEGKQSNDEELPPIETIKERFNVWFEENQNSLKEQLCSRLCPCWKRSKQDLIAAILADPALVFHTTVPYTTVVATILVVGGYLDRLCDGWEDDDPSHDNKPIPKKPEEP